MYTVKKEGFTLLEVMITIAILVVITSIIYPAAMTTRRRVTASTISSGLSGLSSDTLIYYNEQGGSFVDTSTGTDVCDDADMSESIDKLSSDLSGSATFVCVAADQTWAVELEAGWGDKYCVDLEGEVRKNFEVDTNNAVCVAV